MGVLNFWKAAAQGVTLLTVVLVPYFLFGLLIHVWAGGADALNGQCEIGNIHARTHALFSPTRFWTLQLETQEKRISSLQSTRPREGEAALATAQTLKEVKARNPELFDGTSKSEAQRRADELRSAANRIEADEKLEFAKLAHQKELAEALQCRKIVLAHLHSDA